MEENQATSGPVQLNPILFRGQLSFEDLHTGFVVNVLLL